VPFRLQASGEVLYWRPFEGYGRPLRYSPDEEAQLQ
jgi:hypothetical protein